MIIPSALLLMVAAVTIEVTAHGAIANDGLDDSAAFRAAFAAAGVGDTVHAGCGVWDLQYLDNQSAVFVYDKHGVTFAGDGECTSLKMFGGTHTADYHAIHVKLGSAITFRDFACDGNRSNMVNSDEQTHCLNVDGVDGFTLHDAKLEHVWSDGAKFLSGTQTCNNIHVYDVEINDTGRSGLAFHTSQNILVERLTTSGVSDQSVDTEPPSSDDIVNFEIRDSYLGASTTGAATLSLTNGLGMAVYNTTIIGLVGGYHANGVTLAYVNILSPTGAYAGFPSGIDFNDQNDVTMTHVNIEARGAYVGIHSTGLEASLTRHTRWNLSQVRITTDTGRAIDWDGGGPGVLTFDRVRIRSSHPTRYAGTGIYIRSTTSQGMSGVVITNVDIKARTTGIGVTPSYPISMSATGTINLAAAGATGTVCDPGTLTFDRSGLTVTATTANNGCP